MTKTLGKQNKAQRILEAAEEVFVRYGYEDANLNLVLAKVGGSKRTIYKYFDSKLGLFDAVVERLAREVDFKAEDIDISDASEGLKQLCTRHLQLITQSRQLAIFRIVLGETARNPAMAERFYASAPLHSQKTMEQYLVRLNSEGKLKVDDVEMAADQLLGGLRGMAHLNGLFCAAELSGSELKRRVDYAVSNFVQAHSKSAAAG